MSSDIQSGTTVITADDIVNTPAHEPESTASPNTTDYDLPSDWGMLDQEQRAAWFTRERAFRQARRQDTSFGQRYQAAKDAEDRLDTDQFRPDGDLE